MYCRRFTRFLFYVFIYLSNHEAHETEDAHWHMFGCPHEEVNYVGIKWGVQTINGLHPCQQAVGNGLWYQDDPHNHPRHHITPDILLELVFRQPPHHREEAGQGWSDSGHGAHYTLLQLRFDDWNRRLSLANSPLQERRSGQWGFCGFGGFFLHGRREEVEGAQWVLPLRTRVGWKMKWSAVLLRKRGTQTSLYSRWSLRSWSS